MIMVDVPFPLLVPLGAILAACITGAISFFTLMLAKEQKVSEFRQAWIDAFRSELAEFAGHARQIALEQVPVNFMPSSSTLETLERMTEESRRPDPHHESRQRMAQAYYALRLRLNPEEGDHEALLKHLDAVSRALNTRSTREVGTIAELDAMSQVAQTVLKREWNRVKAGEPAFRRSAQAAKWLAIVFGAALLAAVVYLFFYGKSAT
jgi:hypothetical protein